MIVCDVMLNFNSKFEKNKINKKEKRNEKIKIKSTIFNSNIIFISLLKYNYITSKLGIMFFIEVKIIIVRFKDDCFFSISLLLFKFLLLFF